MDAPASPELLPVSVKMTHRYAKVAYLTLAESLLAL